MNFSPRLFLTMTQIQKTRRYKLRATAIVAVIVFWLTVVILAALNILTTR
jgi:hypothetical protein